MDAKAEPSSSKRKRQPVKTPASPSQSSEAASSPAPKPKKPRKATVPLPVPIDIEHLTRLAQGRTRSSEENTPKVKLYLQNLHLQRLERHNAVTGILRNDAVPPLERIKTLVAWYCTREEVAPPGEDPALWPLIEKAAPMLCALGSDPDSFDPSAWPEILAQTTERRLAEDANGRITYYIRLYSRSRKVALAEFRQYMELQPIDAAFSTSRMAISGMGSQATETLKDVLTVCGFQGAEFEVVNVDHASMAPYLQEVYGGQTIKTVDQRQADDEASGGGTRNNNFYLVADVGAIKHFVVTPWTLPIDDPLEWRTRGLLRDLERVFILCLSSPLNSASGGGPPLHRPPAPIRTKFEKVLAGLPPKVIPTPKPDLSEALASQIDEEVKFFQHMRENNQDVGQEMCPAALEAVKRDLCDHIATVNGHVISVNVMKDITAEDFRGRITSGFFTPVMGRGMVLRWDMMGDILRMDGELLSFDTRFLLGPYLDIWRLILIHRWWGLLAIMLAILLGILDPFLVIGHSAPVGHLFINLFLRSSQWTSSFRIDCILDLFNTLGFKL
jgi:hypothetical protein